ncbi:MAG: hypothetical protein ACRD0Y_06655, partial [Terriglobales bacterium]
MRLISSFVLGYHGCSAKTRNALLGGKAFHASANDYDWLGHGIYFWEANPERGLQWAKQHGLARPCAVGAVIEPGECLDLFSAAGIKAVRTAYQELTRASRQAGTPMPCNAGGSDCLRRSLDCAVIEYLFRITDSHYDTVRGIFREGDPIYPTSGFYAKTHI